MDLFLDSNCFLAFFHFSSVDLEELRKLAALLREAKAVLFLPTQVVDEFNRNREAKIDDALKQLRQQTLKLQFPQMCKDYDSYNKLRRLQEQYSHMHQALLEQLGADISARQLKADTIIKELFRHARQIDLNPTIWRRAETRVRKGNPPGKGSSLGDAINWETLLAEAPLHEDLHFVGTDKDFRSPLDNKRLSTFLADEWRKAKSSEIFYYAQLSEFFQQHFPDIRLAEELEKNLAIAELDASNTFAQTHASIAKLRKFAEFSADHVARMVETALHNTQVRWILADPDVHEFFAGLMERHLTFADEAAAQALRSLLMRRVNQPESGGEAIPDHLGR